MEKDYFKDRPIESTQIDKIKIGMEVYLCQANATICQRIRRP